MGSAFEGSRGPSRTFLIDTESTKAAMTFIDPPQSGQQITSTSNTRARSLAHSTRWRRIDPVGATDGGVANAAYRGGESD